MGKNRVFFPQEALDQWLHDNRVDVTDGELVLRAEGRRYKVVEAVRIVAEVTGADDVYDLIGKVKTNTFLHELGAEMLGTSMIIADSAYDVIPGFLGEPVGSFAEHRRGSGDSIPPSSATSDEELLAQYLMQNLE